MPRYSAFWSFYQYLRQAKIDEGHHFNRDALLDEASELWREMGPEDKAPFRHQEDTQKFVTGRPLKTKNLRYSSIPIDPGRRLRTFLESYEDFGDYVSEFSFVMIDFNHRCCRGSDGFWTDSNHDYIPVEVGLCKFSVDGGVEGVYHAFINPHEEIAPECLEVAKEVSETTHMIPLDGLASGISSRDETLSKAISDLILPSIVVVCPFGAKNRVKNCLNYLANDTALGCMDCVEPDVFIEVVRMFGKNKVDINGKLKRNASKASCKYSQHVNFKESTVNNLKSTKPKLSCPHHQQLKRPQFCAQSSSLVTTLQILSILTSEFEVPVERGVRTYDAMSAVSVSSFNDAFITLDSPL